MKFKQKKNDLYAIGGLMGLLVILILILTRGNTLFGSCLDWVNQHATIPEQFRQQFYDTHDLFPSLALNIGAGQNIYYFAYYGLNSPIILLSYLLPFVPMNIYLCIAAIIALFADILLFYHRCRRNHDTVISAVITFLFLVSGPLIMHSHRHLMFVIYMPFLLLGLNACDRLLQGGSRTPLILCAFLVLITSFYFAVGAFLAIIIYTLYQIYNCAPKNKLWQVLLCLFIAGMCAMALLLPTVFSLLQGRDNTASQPLLSMISLPNISTSMYYHYSLGLTATSYIAIIFGARSQKKSLRFLSITLLAMTLLTPICYILNAGMYIDGKALIPLLPIALIPLGDFLEDVKAHKPLHHGRFACIACALLLLCEVFGHDHSPWKFIARFAGESILMLFFLYLYRKKRRFLLTLCPVLLLPMITCISYNQADDLVPSDSRYITDSNTIQTMVDDALANDPGFYRTGNLISTHDSVNQIYGIEYYQTSVYSSSENAYFRNFCLNEMYNNIPYRNSVLLPQSDNFLFNQYMGVRYLLTDSISARYGYEIVAQEGDVALQYSSSALPVGFRAAKLMSTEQYEALDFPYKVEALMSHTIVDNAPSATFEGTIRCVDFELSDYLTEDFPISAVENGFIVHAKENFTLSLDLSAPDHIVFIRFCVAHCDDAASEDFYITINGSTNMLTKAGWKYHNNNYHFEYTLPDDGSGYSVEFSAGNYRISDIEVYQMPYEGAEIAQKVTDEMTINRTKTKGDSICGTISCEEAGLVMLTVPYDEGYQVFVDGSEVPIVLADTAFIGFEVDAGEHNIEIRFTAPGLRVGILLSALGFISFIVVAGIDLYKKKHRKI